MSNTISRGIITWVKAHEKPEKRHFRETMSQLAPWATANLPPVPVKQRNIWVLISLQSLIRQPRHPGNDIYRFHTEKSSLESNISFLFFSPFFAMVMLLPLVLLLAGSDCLQLQTPINPNFLGHPKCDGRSALRSSLIHRIAMLKYLPRVKKLFTAPFFVSSASF